MILPVKEEFVQVAPVLVYLGIIIYEDLPEAYMTAWTVFCSTDKGGLITMCSSVKQVRARTSPGYLLPSFSHSQSRESIPPASFHFLTSEVVILTSL